MPAVTRVCVTVTPLVITRREDELMAAGLDYADAMRQAERELGGSWGYCAPLCEACTGALGIIDMIMLGEVPAGHGE